MPGQERGSYLDLLRNKIDITRVPFSDRGSRLLVHQVPGQSRLLVKLAERLIDLQPGLDTYRHRPPFIHSFSLVDDAGEQLDFEEITTYPHAIQLRTRLGDFRLVFENERVLALGLPAEVTAGVRFHVSPQFWEETERGGVFKAVRNLGYASNDPHVRNKISPKAGGYVVDFVVASADDCAINITIGGSLDPQQTVPPFSTSYANAEDRWRRWFDRTPRVAEKYRAAYAYAWWVMGSNLISPQGRVSYEAMTPSKMSYVGLWLWDSALHALAYRHIDPELARDQIRAMIAHQLSDGMMPDAVFDEGVIAEIDYPITAEVTKPPILAWAALKLHESDPDLDFLREIYVPLVRWNAWWFSMNDDDVDGLAQYNHPYSSGLDDSPLWDYGMPVEPPDLNTYLCVQMGSLAMIAEALGMDAEAAMWRRRAEAIVRRMLEDFWDDEAGLFWALHNEQPVKVVTPFNLYPLWTGQLPEDICDRLIGHLTNPDEFWGEYILPTVSRSDPHYDPQTMWRGPVWANINYFFVEALHQAGKDDLARILRERTLQLVMGHPSIYEYYNAETGDPPELAADMFGWTAAVFIDLVIQASREEGSEE